MENSTEIRLKLPNDLKKEIRKFRAHRELQDKPITSDAKAILFLTAKALMKENYHQ